jgi:hypothetical protein
MKLNELIALDCTDLERVAHADNNNGRRDAWTELSIFYRPCPDTGRNFISEVRARYKSGDGPQRGRDMVRRVYVGSITRALEFFDESQLTDSVELQADDWIDRNAKRLAQAIADSSQNKPRQAPIEGYAGGNGLTGALSWLYEGESGDLSKRIAADFGVSDRTVRDALKKEQDGQKLSGWVLAFIAALSAFDRNTLPHRKVSA